MWMAVLSAQFFDGLSLSKDLPFLRVLWSHYARYAIRPNTSVVANLNDEVLAAIWYREKI